MSVGWRYDPEVDAGALTLRTLLEGEVLAGGIEVSLSDDGTFDLVVHLDESERVVEIEFFGARSLLPSHFTSVAHSADGSEG